MERKPGEGIIRLKGPALVRPSEAVLTGQLSPAAIEMMTGIRILSSSVLSRALLLSPQKVPEQRLLSAGIASSQPVRNFTDDWWGE